MVQNYEWIKIHLASGYTFFMKDFDWDKKVVNQVGQYGIRFFSPTDKIYYTIHQETTDKIILKTIDTFGFNPNFVERCFIVRDKEVEVK